MKTIDFEKEIQKDIDTNLSIRTNPNATDIAGVYYKDVYIGVSVPPVDIKKEHDSNYTDRIGVPYKNKDMAIAFIHGKLEKFKREMEDDPDLFKTDK